MFAHQDDEIAAVSRIVLEIEQGSDVHCVFLTDGARHVPTSTRNSESLTVLRSLGLRDQHVHFLGSSIPIQDGSLVYRLDPALEHLKRAMESLPVRSIYVLAWEGGHHDHDASHLVGLAFARMRGLLAQTNELMLYRGTAGGRFFRVFAPIRGSRWQSRRLGFRQAVRYALLVRHYRSQRWSWAGLFGETFLKLAMMRRELVRVADAARVRTRPHDGPLFYERWFRFPHENFDRASRPFIERYLPVD